MAFTPKNWLDSPSTDTPLSSAALVDLEQRLSNYTDAKLPLAGVNTARPAPSIAGRLYRETDTGFIWQDTGSAWQVYKAQGLVVKAADQTVNNSATFVNDTSLAFPIRASQKVFFRANLDVVGASVNADIKYQWVLPAGATVKWTTNAGNLLGVTVGGTGAALSTTTSSAGLGNYEAAWPAAIGWITNSSTAGTAQFQWAQNTATAEDVVLKAGSLLELLLVTP